jgi:hypothetical protein
MRCPTKGEHSSKREADETDYNWEEGSSQERASIWAMRVSRSMETTRKEHKREERKGRRQSLQT